MLGREIKRGDIIATIGAGLHGVKLVLLNVLDVAPWAINVRHLGEDGKQHDGVRSEGSLVVIVHEADEPYPADAPQP